MQIKYLHHLISICKFKHCMLLYYIGFFGGPVSRFQVPLKAQKGGLYCACKRLLLRLVLCMGQQTCKAACDREHACQDHTLGSLCSCSRSLLLQL